MLKKNAEIYPPLICWVDLEYFSSHIRGRLEKQCICIIIINVVFFCIFKSSKVYFSLIVVYLFVYFIHYSINHIRVCFQVRLGTLDYNPMMQLC